MNWIGKVSNLFPANVQNEQSEEVSQQQSLTNLSTLGISATNDVFETTNLTVSSFDHSLSLPQLTTPLVAEQSSAELVNAEGIFESLNNIDSDLFKLKANQQPPTGKIDWDALLAVKEKLLQDPMDWNAIFNTLEQIPNKSDYFATMGELMKDGNWSKFLEKLPPEADGRLGEHLLSAAKYQDWDSSLGGALVGMLYGISNFNSATTGGNGRFSGMIRELIRSNNLKANQATYCFEILNSDTSPETRLTNLFAMQQLNRQLKVNNDPRFSWQEIDRQISKFFNDYTTGAIQVPAPAIQKAWEEFPEMNNRALLKYDANTFKYTVNPSAFAEKLIEAGENIGPPLSRFIADSASKPGFSGNWLEPFFAALGEKDPAKADDIVREVVNHCIAAGLIQPSPGLLIELKLVLLRGDDTELNQQMINEVIDPAFEIAKNN